MDTTYRADDGATTHGAPNPVHGALNHDPVNDATSDDSTPNHGAVNYTTSDHHHVDHAAGRR